MATEASTFDRIASRFRARTVLEQVQSEKAAEFVLSVGLLLSRWEKAGESLGQRPVFTVEEAADILALKDAARQCNAAAESFAGVLVP